MPTVCVEKTSNKSLLIFLLIVNAEAKVQWWCAYLCAYVKYLWHFPLNIETKKNQNNFKKQIFE